MSTITKAIASEVAIKLVQKKSEAISVMEKELNEKITAAYKAKIPNDVLLMWKEKPDWMELIQSVQLHGNGWNWQNFKLTERLPKNQSKGRTFTPDSKTADMLIKLRDKIEIHAEKMRKTVKEIEVTLFGLRTYKRVEENFPEAFALLPAKISTALSTDISALRSEIKKVP